MPHFEHDDLRLFYVDEGEGAPILLIHGFASNIRVNWVSTGWIESLTRAGFRAVALDVRGHGESDKPHDPEVYTNADLVGDAVALLDHLGLERSHVMGYSMGARVTAFLALEHPERVSRGVLSGLGGNLVDGVGGREEIVAALRAPSLQAVTGERGRMFRAFADATTADREALAACMTSMRANMTTEQLRTIDMPILVAVGTEDDVAGDPERLASALPNGRAFAIEGRDHMKAVGDRSHKRAVVEFLSEP